MKIEIDCVLKFELEISKQIKNVKRDVPHGADLNRWPSLPDPDSLMTGDRGASCDPCNNRLQNKIRC